MQDQDTAEGRYLEALRIDGNFVPALQKLIALYKGRGDWLKAVQYMIRCEEAPGELVEKVADAEAPRPPTPFETENWFTSEFSRLRALNATRVSDGKPPIKPGSIVYRYRGIFRRDPDWSVYNRYRKMYGFTG
jgi:hypothetical protein